MSYISRYKKIRTRKTGHEVLPKYQRSPSPPIKQSMTERAFYQQNHIKKIDHHKNYFDQLQLGVR